MEQQQSNDDFVKVFDDWLAEIDVQNLDAYFKEFPPGFRFCPTDEELIEYLIRKIKNLPMPVNRIMEVNLYQYNPEYLAEKYKKYGEDAWYFFTSTEKKYKHGARPRRDAGNGFWKATGADKSIKSNGLRVGLKKSLVFYRGKPNSKIDENQKTNWIMHEYRIDDNSSQRNSRKGTADMKLDDWVLCRIYENCKGSSSRTRRNGLQNSPPSPLPAPHGLQNFPPLPLPAPVNEPGDNFGMVPPTPINEPGHNFGMVPPTPINEPGHNFGMEPPAYSSQPNIEDGKLEGSNDQYNDWHGPFIKQPPPMSPLLDLQNLYDFPDSSMNWLTNFPP